MARNKPKIAILGLIGTKESMLDQTLREIEQAILPDFYSRLNAIDPGLSARLGNADRRVSMAYRGGDSGELRLALNVLKELYLEGANIVYS